MLQRFFSAPLKPPAQAVLVFAVSALLMLGGVLLDRIGLMDMERLYPWMIGTSFLLLFGVGNSLMSLQSARPSAYWGASVYSYIGLAAANGLLAWQLSGVKLSDADSYKGIYLVVTFGFLVFISIVNMVRNVIRFAEKEEWNAPKQRRR